MKWLHRLTGLVLLVVLAGSGAWVFVTALQGGASWGAFLDAAREQRIHVLIGGAFVGVGLLVYVLTCRAGKSNVHYLSYETEQGNISISLKALQEFLSHLKSDFPSIISLNPRVTAHDETLDVLLEVRIKAGAPIPEVSRMLQERARSLIQEKVGVSDIRDIEVKIEEIIREKETKAQALTPVAPPVDHEAP